MTIADVCEGLKNICATVTGIGTTYESPPPSLDTAKLPALYVVIGDAEDDFSNSGLDYETRTYRVQVAVLPVGQGVPGEAEEIARELIRPLKLAIQARQDFLGVDNVMGLNVSGDTGIRLLAEYGGKYLGFEVRVKVTEIIQFDFVDY